LLIIGYKLLIFQLQQHTALTPENGNTVWLSYERRNEFCDILKQTN